MVCVAEKLVWIDVGLCWDTVRSVHRIKMACRWSRKNIVLSMKTCMFSYLYRSGAFGAFAFAWGTGVIDADVVDVVW